METIATKLRREATLAIEKAFSDVEGLDAFLPAEVVQSSNERFGHYQCNTPLRLAKYLKKNPREVAQKIVEAFSKDSLIEKMEVAGPGFINLFLMKQNLSKELGEILLDERLGVALPKAAKKVIVEFSSPNIAKELHVGHLRSTIIGECIARLFEFIGHDVLRLNHIGDWGTQFGMLITFLKEFHPKLISGEEHATLPELMEYYKVSKKNFDADAAFKTRSQLEVVKLQSGDSTALSAWNRICDISREAFEEIYNLLDVTLTERGESFYNSQLPKVIEDLEKKGMIENSDGAKCIFLDGYKNKDGDPLPIIIQKADGGYNYDTTDMAALIQRVDEEKADRIIYITDAGQSLHFQMLFAAAEKAGYVNRNKVQLDHVTFGVVLGSDGKKFKTRSGETEKLIDLLTTAESEAVKIMRKRMPELSNEEITHMGQVLGIDAIKYADLSGHRMKDYTFSYERMLKFEGNTAAFLLYAYVRIQSIKRKVGKTIDLCMSQSAIELDHPSELALGIHLRQFPETLEFVDRDLLPNRLTDYLYSLAEKFHAFFRDCRVEGSEEEASRLLLCELTGRILAKGLEILGLKTLDKM